MCFDELPRLLNRLNEIKNDELAAIFENRIKVTEKGKPFVRNICMAFDVLLHREVTEKRLVSITI